MTVQKDDVNNEQLLKLNYLKGKQTFRDVKVGEQNRQEVMNNIEG